MEVEVGVLLNAFDIMVLPGSMCQDEVVGKMPVQGRTTSKDRQTRHVGSGVVEEFRSAGLALWASRRAWQLRPGSRDGGGWLGVQGFGFPVALQLGPSSIFAVLRCSRAVRTARRL